jgi:drug/metabolite transporter (DMT)-like permease
LLAVANGSGDNALSTLLVMRLVYPVLLIVVVIVTRAPRVAGRGNIVPAAAAGIGDALAVTLYGVATRSGALPVVAALSSLFPVTTLVLARQIDHERLEREQAIGVALALVGVLLVVTTGS